MTNKAEKFSMFFCMIIMLSVIADFLADLLAIQLFEVGSFAFNGGDFLFPVVYIINDIFTEVYGYKTAKRFIWYGVTVNAFALGVLTFVAYLAGAGTPIYDFAIGDFGVAAAVSVAMAGFVAYIVASFINATIMSKMKAKHGERRFGLRAVVSTLFAELADTSVFCFLLCLFGTYEWDVFLNVTLTITAIKVLVEVLLLPVTKRVVAKVKCIEGISVIADADTNYNPFRLRD